MFKLSLENRKGEKITLTGRETEYQIVRVEGLNPPNATIYTSNSVNMDGSSFNSSRLETRNIVITVKINGDVEKNRNTLYRYIKTKQYCKFYYETSLRNVFTEGYIDTIENSPFDNGQTVQVSIICPDPYLQSFNEILSDISKLIGSFEFPFAFGAGGIVENTITDNAIEFGTYDENRIVTIYNEGAETGLIMTFRIAGGQVTNPIIYDVVSREFFGLNITLENQDIVTINTNRGQKSVILTRNGENINIINYMTPNSTWLQLHEGDNMYTYEVDTGKLYVSSYFTHRTRYQAV